MSLKRIFKIIDNGQIHIQLYNPETDLEGTLSVLKEGFLQHESICLAVGLDKASQGQQDVAKLSVDSLRDGISLVARHLPTNQIVGFAINNISSRPLPGASSSLEEFCKNNKLVEESQNIIKFLQFADGRIDLFERFNTDCYVECLFLTSLPEFRGRKIAYHLVECTMELAREIRAQKYPDTIDRNLIGKKPNIVFAIWTSKYSARIGEKLGFVPLEKIPFQNLKTIGVPYPERIPPEHTQVVLGAVEI